MRLYNAITQTLFWVGRPSSNHTVAFEATFNNNVSVLKALLEINGKYKVDFETPSVLGLSPLGWAFKTGADRVSKLLKDKLYPNAKT